MKLRHEGLEVGIAQGGACVTGGTSAGLLRGRVVDVLTQAISELTTKNRLKSATYRCRRPHDVTAFSNTMAEQSDKLVYISEQWQVGDVMPSMYRCASTYDMPSGGPEAS